MNRRSLRSKMVSRLFLATLTLLGATALYAITPVEDGTWHPATSSGAFSTPALSVEPSLEIHAMGSRAALDTPSLQRFQAAFSAQWEVRQDLRSNRPHLLQGAGVPLIPGRGNQLRAASLGLRPSDAVSLEVVEKAVREFLRNYPEVLRVDGFDLRLDRKHSLPYGKDNYYWTIELQQYHQGVPVEGAKVFFRINHGNVVQFGADRVSEITLDATPALTAEEAFAGALSTLALEAPVSKAVDRGTLKIFPMMDADESYGERYAGAAGQGYQHLLVWEHAFTVEGSDDQLRLLVDAKTGAVLEYRNETVYATVQGQVYPVTNTDPLVTVPFPFTNVTNSTTKVTDANGVYTYSGGTATATLNGRYIRISDACGTISLSNSSTGNLDFSGSGGTDCTTPGIGGTGNTHSARSGYYHLTNINRKAATFLPSNTWINGTVTANMNINLTCNANWNGSAVNFYRSGGGCSNTGEIAAVFLHEWGHGMDTNSGGAASENASGEAVGDTFAFLETKDGCIGENFQPGVPCANCRSFCTGVRDVAAFAQGGISTIATPANIASNTGINCDRFSCPYSTPQGFPYRGPMGYQGHCESYIASTANWDLAQSLVATHGSTAGWSAMDKIWYASLTPSKSAYRVASGGTCNPSASVDGCASTNWYTVFLPADDNDGNLANGTPNGCRIWDAFTAHGIACGTRPACSTGGGSTPVTVTFTSVAAEDGRLWESTETSNIGGGGNATDNTTASLRVGDFSDDTQYKTLVSFDTSSIPDTATITAATLRLKRGTVSGTSPFTTHGTCTVDIRNGGFGTGTAFANGDFEAAATATAVATMSNPTTDGTFSTGTLNATGQGAINKTGRTQLKVYMTLDDNDDLGIDYIGFYSGEAATGNKPELVITYTP